MKITRDWLAAHEPCESGGGWGNVFVGEEGREYAECLTSITRPDWLIWLIAKVEGLAAVTRIMSPECLSITAAPGGWDMVAAQANATFCADKSFQDLCLGRNAMAHAWQFHAFRMKYILALESPYPDRDPEPIIRLAQAALNSLVKSRAETDDINDWKARIVATDLCLEIREHLKRPLPV